MHEMQNMFQNDMHESTFIASTYLPVKKKMQQKPTD